MLFAEGRKCVCGNTGCWEEYAADRALVRIYRETLPSCAEAQPLSAENIVQRARKDDEAARQALKKIGYYLSLGFVNLIYAFNPEAIIVGDYLASGWDLIEEDVWAGLRQRLPQRYLSRIRIIPEPHGGDSILLGAVANVLSHFFTTFHHQASNGQRGDVTVVSAE
jgi:predicted NBD/HSP70 family sugar kinase